LRSIGWPRWAKFHMSADNRRSMVLTEHGFRPDAPEAQAAM